MTDVMCETYQERGCAECSLDLSVTAYLSAGLAHLENFGISSSLGSLKIFML